MNPVEVTGKLAQEGTIEVRRLRGGVMLYKPGDASDSPRGGDALRRIGLGDRN